MKKKKKSFPKKSALLLTASALLLIGSTVGSTRAALTYYSENYSAQIEMQNIGVSLLENGDVVSSQDFTSKNQQEVTPDRPSRRKGEIRTRKEIQRRAQCSEQR